VEILRLLRGLQEKYRLAVIYITHDLSTVRYFSERVFVMYAGNIVEIASVGNLVHNPKHPYTAALMDATSDPDADNARKFRELPPGEPPSLVRPPAGCRFHPRCPKRIENLCDVDEPPYFLPEKDHAVSCWLYK
jgi:peptide/nickel transport system ATP-binding protein